MDAHERKVRKVYDAIRAKNWKGAIKMVETALHKFNNSAVLRSLKAFSLEKLGKFDQAIELCEEIQSTGTIDEQVLHTLGMIYKSMDRMDCLTSAYLAAVEQKGNDLELLQGLFSCYVRECAFAKQQQLAMKMYKISSQSDKYLWWVIISIVLQVWNRPGRESIPPPLGVDKTLKLAQSLIQKQLKNNEVLSSLEGMFLYINILYRQGDASQVLELLNTDLSTVCMRSMQVMVLKAQCMVALNDFEQASKQLREILSIEPDFWIGICELLELFLPIRERVRREYPSWCDLHQESCQLIINHKDSFDGYSSESCINLEEAERAFHFIQSTLTEKIKEASGSSPSLTRCLALVEVEYYFRKMKCGLSEESEFQKSIIHAFEIMGHLNSVTNDLDAFIKHLTNQDQLYDAFEAKRKQLKDEKSSLVNLMEILSSLEIVWDTEQITSFIIEALKNSELENAIISALNLKLMQTSKNPSFHELGTTVWEAFLIVGNASLIPSRPPSIHLAHSALAFLLGAPNKGLEIFEAMEIKHTQLDSIASHFWYPLMRSYHCQEALRKFMLDANGLFTTQKSDVEETTFTAYQEGTYTKILEFISFKERLEMSHTFHLIKCDQNIFQILSSIGDGLESVDQSLLEACVDLDLEKLNGDYFERLIFNEDVRCRPRWLPLFYGDYRFATIEWWKQFLTRIHSTKNDDFEKWKRSRISFLKRRWCIPHLLKRLWLINQEPIGNNEPSSSLVLFFKEAEIPLENALSCLKERLASWESSKSRMQDLQKIYMDFQCNILYLSHLAPCVFKESSDGSNIMKVFQQCIELISEFSQKLISISFNKLETDLSCWVKTAGVLLGAMLNEEVPMIITSLAFWERYYHQQKLQNPELWKIMISFTASMKSVLEMIIQYLSLVDDMDIERVTKNLMVLLGMMEEKSEIHTFQTEIEGKDIDALSIYIEQLNLEEFGLCKEWTLWPTIELPEIQALLKEVFLENKQWSEKLLKLAQNHLKQLLKLSTLE